MAQFDVHRNPGRLRSVIPYVVVVQSAVFDGAPRRVVMPLVLKSEFGRIYNKRFNPTFIVDAVDVVLQPIEMVSIALVDLREPIASLADEGGAIVDAVDELITRAHG